MKKEKNKLIVIAGPTASGKTKLSLEMAKEVNGEIISADSMQVYKHLDIGTAKIKEKEMEGIVHHLIDIIEPAEEYNVQIFQKEAQKLIKDIHKRGKTPLLVGGSGLYIDSVVYDYEFLEEDPNNEIRNRLWEEYEKYGNDYLLEKIKKLDPETYENIDKKNTKRLIRVLEIMEKHGLKFSQTEKDSRRKKESPYDLEYYVIRMKREELYDRINRRVDQMIAQGWLEEVENLLEKNWAKKDYRSMQGLGYRQIIEYLEGQASWEQSVEKIKQETRRFAKRQMTWFRKNKDIIWLEV